MSMMSDVCNVWCQWCRVWCPHSSCRRTLGSFSRVGACGDRSRTTAGEKLVSSAPGVAASRANKPCLFRSRSWAPRSVEEPRPVWVSSLREAAGRAGVSGWRDGWWRLMTRFMMMRVWNARRHDDMTPDDDTVSDDVAFHDTAFGGGDTMPNDTALDNAASDDTLPNVTVRRALGDTAIGDIPPNDTQYRKQLVCSAQQMTFSGYHNNCRWNCFHSWCNIFFSFFVSIRPAAGSWFSAGGSDILLNLMVLRLGRIARRPESALRDISHLLVDMKTYCLSLQQDKLPAHLSPARGLSAALGVSAQRRYHLSTIGRRLKTT